MKCNEGITIRALWKKPFPLHSATVWWGVNHSIFSRQIQSVTISKESMVQCTWIIPMITTCLCRLKICMQLRFNIFHLHLFLYETLTTYVTHLQTFNGSEFYIHVCTILQPYEGQFISVMYFWDNPRQIICTYDCLWQTRLVDTYICISQSPPHCHLFPDNLIQVFH